MPQRYTKFDFKHLFGGYGGSSNMIYVDAKNKVVHKIIPYYNKYKNNKVRFVGDQREIEFYKMFTRDFLKTGETHHIVGIRDHYKIDLRHTLSTVPDVKEVFYSAKLSNRFTKMMLNLRHDNATKRLQNNADVVVLEYCPTTINKYIDKHLKNTKSIKKIQEFVDRVVFQMIHTLACIQKKYPSFVHNDLFLRNILAVEETQSKGVIEYKWGDRVFRLPTNGIHIKLNDFGFSLESKLRNGADRPNAWLLRQPAMNCKKCDIFNFLHDFYDGQGFGATSLMKIYEKNKPVKAAIKAAFRKYIDIKVIDEINKKNKKLLDSTWSIYNVPFLADSVKEPHEYLEDGTFANRSLVTTRLQNVML